MFNRIVLIGYAGAAADLAYTKEGTAYARFSIAVNKYSKDKEAAPDWFAVTAWGKQAEFVAETVHKGSKLFVEGRMESHSYTDNAGMERSAWGVNASLVLLLDRRDTVVPVESEAPE